MPCWLLCCCAVLAWAQTADFETSTNVVLIPVVVRDQSGKAVPGLNREDFRLYEDGKERTITSVTVERRDASSFLPRQFDAYLFDDLHLRFEDFERARMAFERHVNETALADRRIAILTTSTAVSLPFTNSRDALLEAVSRIRPGAGTAVPSCPEVSYYLADRIVRRKDPIAFNIVFRRVRSCMPAIPVALAREIANSEAMRIVNIEGPRTRAALGALGAAIRHLQRTPGSRRVMLVSSGFHLAESEQQSLTSILAEASRYAITVNAVSAAGVQLVGVDTTPLDASDWLKSAAGQTGGAYAGTNDTTAALKRLMDPPEYTYVLAFQPPTFGEPGKRHRVEVKLNRGRGFSLQARREYFEHRPLPASDAVRNALFSSADVQDLDLTFEVSPLRASSIRVAARVGGSRLPLRAKQGRHHNSLMLAFGVFDSDGRLTSHVIRQAELQIDDAALVKLQQSGLTLSADLPVPAGDYFLRIAAREDATGKVAAIGRIVRRD